MAIMLAIVMSEAWCHDDSQHQRGRGSGQPAELFVSREAAFNTSRTPNVDEVCDNCRSRADQIRLGTAFIPLFIKFHKTGGGTISSLLRRHCLEISGRVPGSRFPWISGKKCGVVPYEHGSMKMFRTGGLRLFEACAQHRFSVRLYTILRDPVDKLLSAFYFWKRPRGKPLPEDLQRSLQSPQNMSISGADKLVRHFFPEMAESERGTTAGVGGYFFEYGAVFGRYQGDQSSTPTSQHLQRPYSMPLSLVQITSACQALRDEFTVGVLDQMDSFRVLVAVENGWPIEDLCHPDSLTHVNSKRPRWPPKIIAHLGNVLASENELVQCARVIHAEQTAEMGARFATSFAKFQSPGFKENCTRISRSYLEVKYLHATSPTSRHSTREKEKVACGRSWGVQDFQEDKTRPAI